VLKNAFKNNAFKKVIDIVFSIKVHFLHQAHGTENAKNGAYGDYLIIIAHRHEKFLQEY
jgi:hypothetical protein